VAKQLAVCKFVTHSCRTQSVLPYVVLASKAKRKKNENFQLAQLAKIELQPV
jgi:hypothetical protein